MHHLERLTRADEANVALEAPDTPMHQAALGVLEAPSLVDGTGHVRLGEIRDHISARLDRVPELRRVLRATGPLEGRPLWIDDPAFRIENHVLAAALPPPGGEPAALAFAERRMSELMDRSRPLWEIWFLEGYGAGQVGIFIKLHHAVADGRAMINLIGQVFDIEPRPFERPGTGWTASSPPSWRALIADNMASKPASVRRFGRKLAHPSAMLRSAQLLARGFKAGRHAPRTSLNSPIHVPRRLAAVRLTLGEAKAAGHLAGVKLNDVFHAVVAAGLRRVLLARGESVDGVEIHTSMAVSMHPSGDATTVGNNIGSVIVRLPVDVPEVHALLTRVARESLRAKATQVPVITSGLMVFLARAGLTRMYIRHQHMINILTTNLPGPPVPLYLAGAKLVDAIAIPPIAGNVTVSFAALSYVDGLNLTIVADAVAWPDIDVLVDGMRSAWVDLQRDVSSVSLIERPTALSA